MKRYSEYKDSGVKWIGEIPGHWKCIKSKWLLHERNERSEDGLDEPLSMSQKLGLVPTSDLGSIPNLASSYVGAKIVYKGDMVLNKLKAHLGVFALSNYKGLVSPDYAVYYSTQITNFNYLLYLYKTPLYIAEFIKRTTGIAIGFNRLYTNDLYSIYTHYPPLPEQEAIVTYLDSKVAKIDEYISIAEKKIAALEELKQTIIAEAVTRGIHKDVPMKGSGVKWIGMIPEHWNLKRTAMLFSENRKKNINYEFDHALKFNYGKLVPKNEIGDVSSLKETYMAYTIINKNDIAINCLNLNYDFVSQRVAISPQKGIITSAYLIITPRQGVEAMYFNYLFKAMDSKKLFHGMGTGIRLTLSFSELKKQQIPVPPLPEQQEIVSYIETKAAKINQLCQAERSQIEKLKEYKQRLISDVVTGKVKVTNDSLNGRV